MVGGTTPPQSDSGEISRVLVLNLLWQSKRCSRTAQDISVLTTPSLLSRGTRQYPYRLVRPLWSSARNLSREERGNREAFSRFRMLRWSLPSRFFLSSSAPEERQNA